jgi:hypothetical protein
MHPIRSLLVQYAIPRRRAFQFALLLLLLGPQTALAQTRSPLSAELRELLDIYHSDFNTPEHYDKAAHELATRPEFKPMLLEMLQREYFQALKVADGKPTMEALGPLTLRSDLSAAEQKIFTDEMERLLGDPKAYSFVNGGINLLAHYPSQEHEDLVLRFLNRAQNQDYTFVAAFKTLSVIGGPKSLEAIRRVADHLRKNYSPGDWFIAELDSHIVALETRLKQASTGPPTANALVQVSPTVSTTNLPDHGTPEAPVERPVGWRIWAGLLGGLILVIALGCRAFRKR